MRKLFIGLFFGLVVAMSLSARATEMTIENISANENLRLLEITGHFSTPCVTNPHPALKVIDNDTLELSVRGEVLDSLCIQVVGPKTSLAFDFKALKSELQKMNLDTNKSYHVMNVTTRFSMTIDFSQNILPKQFSSHSMAGVLTEKQNKLFIESVEVISPFIDLTPAIGSHIEIFGHLAGATMSSGRMSQDPFGLSMNTNAQFLLTGVSLTD